MDDDGIELSFATTTDSQKLTVKDFFGDRGSWKKRRLVAKIKLHRTSKGSRFAPLNKTVDAAKHKAVAQKPISNPTASKSQSKGSTRTGPRTDDSNARQPTARKPDASAGGFVSSLFSGNPAFNSKSVPGQIDSKFSRDASNAIPSASLSSFEGLGLSGALCRHLNAKLGMTTPTGIQQAAIPRLLQTTATDVIIQAQTGSGKTLAYLLPILQRIMEAGRAGTGLEMDRSMGTLGIILLPTRELAKQILDVVDSLLRFSVFAKREDDSATEVGPGAETGTELEAKERHWMVSGLVVGGDKKKSEKARLRRGCTLLVSTPGRLLDHLKTTKAFEVGNLRWIVVDEADRLMELGFENTLKEILIIIDERRHFAETSLKRLSHPMLPVERQLVLTSATIEENVKKLAETSLKGPVYVQTADGSSQKQQAALMEGSVEHFKAPTQLRQMYVIIPAKLRLVSLAGVIRKLQSVSKKMFKALVFVDTCDSVDFLHGLFCRTVDRSSSDQADGKEGEDESLVKPAAMEGNGLQSPLFPGVSIYRLHGELSQVVRSSTYKEFQKSERAVLFCTDVAARGLDLSDITDVIQYDMPLDARDYVHRIGRTARLGRDGRAFSFLLPSEQLYIDRLKELGMSLEEVGVKDILAPLSSVSLPSTENARQKGQRRAVEDAAMDVQMLFERFVLCDYKMLETARSAFKSHIRAYATHPAKDRDIFHVRKLHLGHVAKSFALRDAPASQGNQGMKQGKDSSKLPARRKTNNKRKVDKSAEFSSGLVFKRTKIS